MKKRLLVNIILFFILFSVMVPGVHAHTPTENVIVVFKDEIDKKAVTSVNGEIDETFKNLSVISGEVPVDAISYLKKDRDILSVEVDQRVQLKGQVADWGIQSINAQAAWQSRYTGKGINIAVLDTGISPHVDLVLAGGGSMTPYTNSYYDDNGHGTHVAGIIGARNNDIGTVGVAPEANLYAVKVLDQNGTGYLSDILAGIDWAITNKMDILNLSLGLSHESVALEQTVDKAYSAGMMVVAAAGNSGTVDGSGNTVEYPARYDSVIAVAAIDNLNQRGFFSSTGDEIEISAPGVNVVSTYLNNHYAMMSGTSMAAPYVSGTLALLKQQNPLMSNSQLRELLKSTTVDLGIKGKDPLFGFGLVQGPTFTQVANTPIQEEATIPVENPVPTSTPSTVDQPSPVKIVPKKLIKPTPKKYLSPFITVSRTSYYVGDTISLNLKVVDKMTKKPMKNAIVKLNITPPIGETTVVTLKTNSKGEASYRELVTYQTSKGAYTFLAFITVDDYHNAYSKGTIRVR
jgi:minor extracellular protease Epr